MAYGESNGNGHVTDDVR